MRLRYPGFNFFFIASLMIILLLTIVINFGRINTLAITLTTPLASQIETSQSNTAQPESQIGKIARDVKDQLQLKDLDQATAKKSEQLSQGMMSHIVRKYQKKGKMKQPGGLKGNIGWLTF